jgi:hypothetical protein
MSVVRRSFRRSWIGPGGSFHSWRDGGLNGVHAGLARASERGLLPTSATAENTPSPPAPAE